MQERMDLQDVFRKFRRHFVLSLVICILMVPVFDAFVLQRDRNRNMVYGELFWSEGFAVYGISDEDLNSTYSIPNDHLLTGVLNVTYEYPVLTLLFYATVALVEPGFTEGTHWLANWILVFIVHINLIIFLYVGQDYWNKKWFKQFFVAFYGFGLAYSIGFAKTEPLSDLFWLCSLYLLKERKFVHASVALALATQTKIYPVMSLPFFLAASPLSLIVFILVAGALSIPLLLSGVSYTTLLAHLSNSSSYSSIITNPFYLGLSLSNPIAIFAPILLTVGIIFSLYKLRVSWSSWRVILIFITPIILVLFSWVLIWYYAWFLIPVLLLEKDDEAMNYRYVIGFIWLAHFVGILTNFELFLNGPLAEFFGHLK
jgi:hypothetical protein